MKQSFKYPKNLMAELRRQGFKRESSYKSVWAGNNVVIYKKMVGDRELTAQLWLTGGHRVSHMLNGHGSTVPTDFGTVKELRAAIAHELTRTDHKKF